MKIPSVGFKVNAQDVTVSPYVVQGSGARLDRIPRSRVPNMPPQNINIDHIRQVFDRLDPGQMKAATRILKCAYQEFMETQSSLRTQWWPRIRMVEDANERPFVRWLSFFV